MALFGGANKIIVRAIQAGDHGLETGHVARDQLARRQPFLGCGLQHLDAGARLVPVRKNTS